MGARRGEVHGHRRDARAQAGRRLRRRRRHRPGLRGDLDAPRQGDEGAPDAWIVVDPAFAPALDGIAVGDRIIVLTWLHLGQRDMLRTHARGDSSRPEQGVFSTRSPDRPNPIGLHPVEVLAIDGDRLRVAPLEAIAGTPVIDIKPEL